ncbi:ankyrin repeat domain-containing protein [Nonlabens sp.]|uniref:ankyrin repeat domain-containing protein n=1 Tax=Nonlabens sp. TaxID=1888209 RepID=UPI001BCDFEFF|nr:ankyrin repeat domain-containing protein [Nonlabens sp.]
MKKVLFILALILAGTASAQDLTKDMTIALKNDSPRDLKILVNDTNKNECLQAGTRKATLLQLAVQMGSSDVALYLMTEAKVDVNKACNDNTPLMWAAKMGRADLVAQLLDAGADTSIQVDGTTALQLAVTNGNEATIKLLK